MSELLFITIDEHKTRWLGAGIVSYWLCWKCLSLVYYRRFLTVSYGEAHMLESIALILIILWVLGLVSSYTLGGFVHILLVIAVIVIILRVIQGRNVV